MSPQFIKARKEGKKAQAYVTGMFKSWGWTVKEVGDGYHPAYDQIITKPFQFKNEIKWDKKSSETQNIYLDINSLQKSQASILTICLNDPIDTVLMLPLQQALEYAQAHRNGSGGEYKEAAAIIPKEQFISDLRPKILTTK